MIIGNGGLQGITKGPGYNTINKYGVNFDIDTADIPEDIWSHGGLFPFLDAGIEMDFKSDNAADTLAGTGAQKIKITYYDSANVENTQEFDMNGVTAVQIADDVKIVTRIEVSQTGIDMTNAGEINVVDRATGSTVYQSVEVGEGQTLSTPQICPAGKKGLVKKHSISFAKAQAPFGSADMRLNLRKANGSVQSKHVVVLSSDNTNDLVSYDIGGIEMEAGDIIYWHCVSVSANDTPIEGRIDIEFEDA